MDIMIWTEFLREDVDGLMLEVPELVQCMLKENVHFK